MTRKQLFLIPMIALDSVGFFVNYSSADSEDKKFSRVISKFQRQVAWKGFLLAGIGSGQNKGKTDLLSVSMETEYLANENQAKSLVIELGSDFLAIINADKKIRPYLYEYPYPIEGIDVGVVWRLKESEREDYVAAATISRGRVMLWRENHDDTITVIYDEPIEVAVNECEQVSSFQ